MLIVESWLRNFVNPPLNTKELAHAMTMAGIEVESIRSAAPMFSGVVVAQILSIEKHPLADKLNICTVDIGLNEPLQIVCGASNLKLGMKAPLAKVGAVLPDKIKISKGKLRGIDSFGMLCSKRELGLSVDDTLGLWHLPNTLTIGQDIRIAMNLDDTVLEVKLTPNKADCLSIWGMAREIAAITQTPLSPKKNSLTHFNLLSNIDFTIDSTIETVPIHIQVDGLCGRFTGRVIKGVSNNSITHPTPDWMVSRLERAGQRSISPLVDISNYVMLEMGQPSHIFDLHQLADIKTNGLTVRWVQSEETVHLLNGQTVVLNENMGVIADSQGVQALAGIMGGEKSAVNEYTKDIYLETAFWYPQAIQGKARTLGIVSDAAYRFERGVDFSKTDVYLDYISHLIIVICGGQSGIAQDIITDLPMRAPINLRLTRCHKVLGIPISPKEIADIFTRLGFEWTVNSLTGDITDSMDFNDFNTSNTVFTVIPPAYRFDLNIEEDLIEEVIRLYGFEKIPANLPIAQYTMYTQSEHIHSLHYLRFALAQRDYIEAINYSFVDSAWEKDFTNNHRPITVLNPIANTMNVMRSSLLGGLVANVKYHISHRINRVRMFELGKVFLRNDSIESNYTAIAGYEQPQRLCAVAYGTVSDSNWNTTERWVDFYDLKADLDALCSGLVYKKATHNALHPGRSAHVWYNQTIIGYIGELHPNLCQSYGLHSPLMVFEVDAQALCIRSFPMYQTVAKTPIIERDLAVIVDVDLPVQLLIDTIKYANEPALKYVISIALFDQFKGGNVAPNKKSIGLRLQLQDKHATLTDMQADAALHAALNILNNQLGAVLR